MRRALFLFAIGAALGAAATFWSLREPRPHPPTARYASATRAPRPAVPSIASAARDTRLAAWLEGAPTAAKRADLYALAAESDVSRLPALVAEAAEAVPSAARDTAVDALLMRYAELDPAAATQLGRSAEAPTETLAALFRAWIVTDEQAALAALGTLDDSAAETIGLAMLRALDGSEAAFAAVRKALPEAARTDFRAVVLGAQAESAPAAALARALALADATERASAASRVAEVWTRQNAYEAVTQLELVEDPNLRPLLIAAALRQWGRSDPVAMADYLAKADSLTQSLAMQAGGVQELMQLDPKRALEVAPRLPAPFGNIVMGSALSRLAASDVAGALAYANTLPAGERQQAMQAIALSYGRAQPDAALAWARSLRPPQPSVVSAVIGGIAQVDAARALDLALESPSSFTLGVMPVELTVIANAARDSVQAAAVANRLLTVDNVQRRQQALSQLLSMWSSQDPAMAIEWIAANGAALDPGSFQNIAQQLGIRDPEAGTAATDRIPAEARGYWIAGLAQGYAQNDPDAALAWLDQYSGQPGYAEGVAAVAASMARYDAPGAARLLASVGTAKPEMRGPVFNIAQQWAQQDPAATAAWAADLADESMRSQVTTLVARVWAASDPPGARDWVLRMPAGAARDAVIGPVLAGTAAKGVPDAALLNAFSSDIARQQGLVRTIFEIAQRSPDNARELVDRYVTDPALRQQAESMLANTRRSANAISVVNGAPALVFPSGNPVGVLPPPVRRTPPR